MTDNDRRCYRLRCVAIGVHADRVFAQTCERLLIDVEDAMITGPLNAIALAERGRARRHEAIR